MTQHRCRIIDVVSLIRLAGAGCQHKGWSSVAKRTRNTSAHLRELRYLILAAQREGSRRLAAALRELDLTPAQAEVLDVLTGREPITLAALGRLLVCEAGS